MRNALFLSLAILGFFAETVYAQKKPVDRVSFFAEERPFEWTIGANWSKLYNQKLKEGRLFPARVQGIMPDSTSVNEFLDLEVRGHVRREMCQLPPLKLKFKKSDSSVLSSLKSIKLVNVCRANDYYEQLLYKEYLIYKMYNLFTEKSFRVRLGQVNYFDSSGKKKNMNEPIFLVEDIDQMAKRNGCKEWTKGKLHTESTDRKQMTLVAIFEYMIGNTDWGVQSGHNIKLIQSDSNATARPFVIPYDFDYAGLVSADYAVPDPMLDIKDVQTRLYRGYPRTMEEIDEVLKIFQEKKDAIYTMINGFEKLSARSRKDMIDYLEEFYKTIQDPREVKYKFVDKARAD